MLPADVEAATEMILRNDWGVRRDWLSFAATQAACRPIVAEADGVIVGTGVGTANGAVGWIGTIFLEPEWRGQGLGRALTQAIIDQLEEAGCRTLVLVATQDGRRLYEKMDFRVQTRYRILEAPGLPTGSAGSTTAAAEGPVVRPFNPSDLDFLHALDRAATGEDRRHALERFAAPETAKVAVMPDGSIGGFVIRAPWGGGATVARSPDAATAIVTARRETSGPTGRVRVGILAGNAAGAAKLVGLGFEQRWSAPRMIRGEPLHWHPSWIWGQFNHAMG
jgi:GNAT superfamily N-acetyltransferase